jgi:hypothetical protein
LLSPIILQDLLKNLEIKINLDRAKTNIGKKVFNLLPYSSLDSLASWKGMQVSIIALLCLGHRGLVSNMKSTCPQGDYPVTKIGDSTGEEIWFLFPFLGLVLAFDHYLTLSMLCLWSLDVFLGLGLILHTRFLHVFWVFFNFWAMFLSSERPTLPFLYHQGIGTPLQDPTENCNALVPLTPKCYPFFCKNLLGSSFSQSSFCWFICSRFMLS